MLQYFKLGIDNKIVLSLPIFDFPSVYRRRGLFCIEGSLKIYRGVENKVITSLACPASTSFQVKGSSLFTFQSSEKNFKVMEYARAVYLSKTL